MRVGSEGGAREGKGRHGGERAFAGRPEGWREAAPARMSAGALERPPWGCRVRRRERQPASASSPSNLCDGRVSP